MNNINTKFEVFESIHIMWKAKNPLAKETTKTWQVPVDYSDPVQDTTRFAPCDSMYTYVYDLFVRTGVCVDR